MSGLNSFYDYLTSLSPAMATAFIRGSAECWDSYARPRIITPGTAGVGLKWARDGKGYYLGQEKSATAGGGSVSIVDSGAAPELRVASGMLFWTARNFQTLPPDYVTAIKSRVYSKVDAGGTDLEVIIQGANTLWITDGVNIRAAASTALTGARTVALRWVTGAIPQLFVDGTFRANAAGTIAPTGNDANLTLMNYGAVLSYGSRINDYGLMCTFNDAILGRALTDQEIKNLSELWDQIGSVFTPDRTIWLPRKATEVIAPAPLAQWYGNRTPANVKLDVSGNGRNLDITGRVTEGHSNKCMCQSAHGAGSPLMRSATSFGYDAANWTLEFDYLARSAGEGGHGSLFVLTDGVGAGGDYAHLKFSAANTLQYTIRHATTNGVWTFSSGPYNVPHHLIIKHARSTLAAPVVELDGETVVVTETSTPVGATSPLAGPRVNFFNIYPELNSAFDGTLATPKFYDSILSVADSRALYRQWALQGNVLAHRTDYPISVAAVAAGGGVGPWRVLSGTHKWDDDGTRRKLLGVTAGYFASREASPQAYGAWYFRTKKGTDLIAHYVPLMASGPGLLTGGSQNGYTVGFSSTESLIIQRWSAGVQAAINAPTPALPWGVEYEFFITRQSVATADGHAAGYFEIWVRGGAYLTWTLVSAATDDTHKTSNCLVGYFNTDSYISDYKQYPNGSGLVPTDVPGLEN